MRALLVSMSAAVWVLGSSAAADAAFPTRVLTAVEKGDPLPEAWLGVGFEHRRKTANISREWINVDPDDPSRRTATDVRELDFTEYEHRLNIDLRVGVFRDLELHVRAPIVLAYRSEIGFQDGVDNSTIFGPPGGFADDPSFDYRYPLTAVPAARERAGFGDMTFGLSWAPFVDAKDEAYPTMVLTGDIIAPTGSIWDPTDQEALPGVPGSGSVGRGQTVFDLSVALSKRQRDETPSFDPYLVLGARIPIATPSQKDRGMEPPASGRVRVGSEVIIHDDPDRASRYAVDLSFAFRYVAIGRTYSPLSDYLPNFDQTAVVANRDPQSNLPIDAVTYDDYADRDNYAQRLEGASCGKLTGVPCGELNRVDEHMEMGGRLALHLQPNEWIVFRGGVELGFVTDHLITAEKVGEDTDPLSARNVSCPAGSGSPCVGRVNARNSQGEDERSPYYDPRYDQPGRRLRAEGIFTLTAFATLNVTF